MLRKIFLLIFLIICFAPAAARAHDIVVVQGLQIKPYDEAVRGFRNSCDANTKKFLLSDLGGTDFVRLIREERPRLILAVGPEALKKVRPIMDIPIVYLMVINPQSMVKGHRNVTGVAMNVAPEKYLDLLTRISPKPKMVGVICDPAKSGYLVKRAQQAARGRGIELAVREVQTPREVPDALTSLKGIVDALWMFPDTTVVTPETVELFLLTSQENRFPVIGFAGKYVEMGALAALDIDSFDQGRQAGEMAARILDGSAVADLPGGEARSTTVKVNRSVAKKLGISLENIDRLTPSKF
jgi:putative ABC transport system substrate-binding protein